MYVTEYFALRDETVDELQEMETNFGYDGFGELVFYRTYSRTKHGGGQENWADVVIRTIMGTLSIRKDWYLKNGIEWDEGWWQKYARGMAVSLFNMYWTPPGRGLWAMGTQFVYERGSMSLYNCAATYIKAHTFAKDIGWLMDALMLGVGVGFEPVRDALHVKRPEGTYLYIISDDKEGWVRSTELLIEAYTNPHARKIPKFDYSQIRGPGLPIRGFGGLSSGPAPLKELHRRIQVFFERYMNENTYDVVQLKTDVANCVGCCVVAGNVRRSAEIAMASIDDPVFMDLKDYALYPERTQWGWMSNNTVKLSEPRHFDMLGEIAKRVPLRGEPGIANLCNFPEGRIGKKKLPRKDKATLLNPCGEITLEDKEVCNLSITCPTRCPDIETWYKAAEYATMYSSTVSLLPTHQSQTNAVIARNRRIGVDIIDGALWVESTGLHKVTKYLRKGYKVVRRTNRWANGQAGVPESIKVTTIKPGGTVSKLAGCVGGIGNPTFNHTKRRIRVAANAPIVPVLEKAGVPRETCVFDPNTLIYSVATYQQGTPASRVSLWQQAMMLVTFQREWSDNAVSNTLYFQPKWVLEWVCKNKEAIDVLSKNGGEELKEAMTVLWDKASDFAEYDMFLTDKKTKLTIGKGKIKCYQYNPNHEEDVIGQVAAHIAPLIKACSFLPHSETGVYEQMPEEGLQGEYVASNYQFDWSLLTNSEGQDERYCDANGVCEIVPHN